MGFIFRFLSVLVLGVSLVTASAQSVSVQVDGLSPKVRRVFIVSFDDYLSLTPRYWSESVPADGKAYLSFRIDKPCWIRLSGGGVHYDFIASPDLSYSFATETDESGAAYFVRKNINNPQSDPNVWADSVNVLVNTFLNQNNTALYTGSLAKKTALFCDSVFTSFQFRKDPLFQTYLSFRLDELRLLARVFSDQAFFATRIKDGPFRPENPDYAYAFSEVYKGRLKETLLRKKMEPAKELINRYKGRDTLMKFLSADFYYPYNEAGEGGVVFGISELWFDKTYNRDALLYLLTQFADSSKHESVKGVASRLYKKLRAPVAGEQAPSVALSDAGGKLWNVPSDFNRPVYLCFFAPESEVATAEMAALNELKKKWKDRIVPVTVLINSTREHLSRTRNALRLSYDLFLNTEFSALADFRLKNDCTCMVLSPDGTFLMPQAPLPSDPDAEIKLSEFMRK